jgi:hypothetical protein
MELLEPTKLERLLDLAPKQQDYPDEESYLEARDGFKRMMSVILQRLPSTSSQGSELALRAALSEM